MATAGNSGPIVVPHALSRFIDFVEGIALHPGAPALSPEVAVRLRRFLIRIANGSSPAIRLAERFQRGEIDGNKLLEMMW